MLLVVGCSAPQSGSAVLAGDSPTGTAVDGSASIPPGVPSTPYAWTMAVRKGPGQGILSPTGDLTANIVAGSVCFAPAGGIGGCGSLARGAAPTFAAFSPDGSHLLIIAGTPGALGAYVFDVSDASVRVLGPAGVQDFPPGTTPPLWDLSTAAWNVDGSAVLLVPRTTEATGPVLAFDVGSGAVVELIRIDASLANSTPSIFSTTTGLALVANTGEQRNILWWADFANGSVTELANYPLPGGSIALIAADPGGRSVLICPRRADGALGATNAVVVQQPAPAGGHAVKLLPDSVSCAGSVFSADGRYLAATAEVDAAYRVLIIDQSSGATVLNAPLPVATPSKPPYLTWLDDAIVATDVGGQWPIPSLLITLTR